MSTKRFTGFLRDPLSEYASGDKWRFTHLTTTGEVIKGSQSIFTVAANGFYDITIEYGNVVIESRDKLTQKWINHGSKVINASTVVTTLPALLNATTPVSEPVLLQMEALLADAELAADQAEVARLASESFTSGIAYSDPLADMSGGLDSTASGGFFKFGSLSGAGKWVGAALAKNGNIYCAPLSSTQILEISPLTRKTRLFGTIAGANKFQGAVAANGFVYFIPFSSSVVTKLNPENDSLTSFGTVTVASAYNGGVLHPNGNIYCAPSSADNIFVINTSNDTITTISTGLVGQAAGKYVGAVISKEGNIYFAPHNASQIMKLTVATGQVSFIGNYPSSSSFIGGCIGKNGVLYLAPASHSAIVAINTELDTVTEISTGGVVYSGATSAPNGMIYFTPRDSGYLTRLDPITGTVRKTRAMGLISSSYFGSVLAPNGCMYAIPRDATSVTEIADGAYGENWWALSAHVNKA